MAESLTLRDTKVPLKEMKRRMKRIEARDDCAVYIFLSRTEPPHSWCRVCDRRWKDSEPMNHQDDCPEFTQCD